MREMHPAIAELKRRNRAVGQRLLPIESPTTSAKTIPRPPATAHHASTVRPTARAREDGHALAPRFASTVTVSATSRGKPNTTPAGSRSNSSTKINTNATGGGPARPPVRRPLAKPSPSLLTAKPKIATNPGGGRAEPAVEASRESGPSSVPSKTTARDVGRQNAPDVALTSHSSLFDSDSKSSARAINERKMAAAASHRNWTRSINEEDEIQSVEGYRNRKSWNNALPQRVCDILDGEQMEEPYTTDLWEYVLEEEKETRARGYYACIRCGVPIVASDFQIPFSIRGIAAFSRLNVCAVEVRVGVSKTHKSDSLKLHVHCQCCHGFLGILTPYNELESDFVETQNVFVVNSCCLVLVPKGRTRCRLDGIYAEEEENNLDDKELTRGDSRDDDNMDIDFDDPNIFEI